MDLVNLCEDISLENLEEWSIRHRSFWAGVWRSAEVRFPSLRRLIVLESDLMYVKNLSEIESEHRAVLVPSRFSAFFDSLRNVLIAAPRLSQVVICHPNADTESIETRSVLNQFNATSGFPWTLVVQSMNKSRRLFPLSNTVDPFSQSPTS